MFTLPSIVLSFIIASLIGLIFFLIFGKGWVRFGVYWLVALAGFSAGQIITSFFGFSLFPIGSVNVLVQLEPLAVPSIDVGISIECLIDPERRLERPFLLDDDRRKLGG